MITTIKNFSVFKSNNENPKAPTHRINAKIGDNFIEIGAGWTKETQKGDKYISAKLSEAYIDKADRTKSRKSLVIVFEEDLIELCKKAGVEYDFNMPPKGI